MMKFGDTWKRAEATPQSTPRPYVVREERRSVCLFVCLFIAVSNHCEICQMFFH